jgi:hypothetical protein
LKPRKEKVLILDAGGAIPQLMEALEVLNESGLQVVQSLQAA